MCKLSIAKMSLVFASIFVFGCLSNLVGQEAPAPGTLFQDDAKKAEEPKSEAKPAAAAKPAQDKPEEAKGNEAKSKDADATEKDSKDKADKSDKSEKIEKAEKAPAKKQLRQLSLSGNYQDHMQPMEFDPTSLILGASPGKSKSFFRLCEYIDELGKDELVSHVLFDLSDDNLSLNSPQLDELVRRMAILKSKGKRMIAWLENAGNEHLSIASQCDDIIMADFGSVDMPSSALSTTFYRDAMDLVGVKASIVRAGDFKGAVEPFMNSQMSPHLREHYVKMLESINAAQVSRIAKGRGLTTASIREMQKKRMLLPADALAGGLVTKLAPYGSMKKTIQEMVGNEIEWTTPKSKPKKEMSFFELMGKIMGGADESKAKIKDDSIVIMHLQGAIVDGKQPSAGSIVSGPTVKAIEELIKDEKVKGVVVRVNSPGGSATASEAIRQALDQLAKKKPVVYSMGEMAASGGYWVTCIGQPIYAEHGTITGSIGVFSMKISLGTLMRRVGLHVESVAIDSSASMNAMDRSWTDEEIGNFQKFIDEVYHRFLNLASESRKLPVDKVKELAGGRVWSGEQAKAAGLVDEIGGVYDCMAVVAKKAGIEKYKVVHRPEPHAGLGLLSMFEEPDDSQVRSALSTLETNVLKSLESHGLKTDGLRAILNAAVREQKGLPTIWALTPGEISVK
ncbi:MAG: signal peptide peptidase SppA [Pirellulales bacterium]